jgi:translation initiation factor 2 beta subunit (eIF-2beta)/eIF-5
MKKICGNCLQEKFLESFYKDSSNKIDGHYTICKKCKNSKTNEWRNKNRDHYNLKAKDWRKKHGANLYASEIKRRYKCDLNQYNQLLKEQDFKCKICEYVHNPLKKRGRLYVDHCHATLKVRALLCNLCNSGIGYFKHSPSLLKKASDYCQEYS